MSIAKKIKKARIEFGLTQVELSKKCGWGDSNVRIARYEKGTRNPDLDDLKKIAKSLELSIDYFVHDDKIVKHPTYVVPLLSDVSAGIWLESYAVPDEDIEIVSTATKVSEKAFALTVKGDSMTSPYPNETSFPNGTVIIVDPEVESFSGAYVVAHLCETDKYVFKQLKCDVDGSYLMPLNPRFNKLKTGKDIHVIGTVVQSQRNTLY